MYICEVMQMRNEQTVSSCTTRSAHWFQLITRCTSTDEDGRRECSLYLI